MKLMYLVVRNIIHTFLQDQYLFILMISCTAVSTFGIYFYSYYLAEYYETYDCEKHDIVQITGLRSDMADRMIQSIDDLDISLVRDVYCTGSSQDGSMPVMGEYHADYESRMLSGTLFDINEENNKVIVDELTMTMAEEVSFEDTPIGAEILINQIPYSVAGVCTITEYEEAIVPVKYYIRNYPVESILIRFQERMDEGHRSEMEQVFEYGTCMWQEPESIWRNSDFLIRMFQILLIFMVILINIYIIAFYTARKQREKLNKYLVCGASGKQITFVLLWQTFLQEIPGILLGIFVFSAVHFGLKDYHILYQSKNASLFCIIFVLNLVLHVLFSVAICYCSQLSCSSVAEQMKKYK